MDLTNFFNKVSDKLRIDFTDLSKLIGHNLSSGEAREEALKGFLGSNLPQRAGVSSGFVIDRNGKESKQIDIIIYDRNYGSYFQIGGANFFPCEIVMAVGEVKSDVSSTDRLIDALEKIKSVKELDRGHSENTEMITGPGQSLKGLKYDPLNFYRDQIFGFIFSANSLAKDTFLESFKAWRKKKERRCWLNLACFYDDFLMSYEIPGSLSPDPNNAKYIYTTKTHDQKNNILLFYLIVNNFINMAHIARPSLFDYCKMGSSDVEYHDL
jgi:hypothetical protein